MAVRASLGSPMVLLTLLAAAASPVAAREPEPPRPGFLDRIEASLERDLVAARADQRKNRDTLASVRPLLERARAGKDAAAVAAAQRALDVAGEALRVNQVREQRVVRALEWVARLRSEGASEGSLRAFLPRVDGRVEVQPGAGGSPRLITGDLPPVLAAGDTVRTGDGGRAVLLLPEGGVLDLDAGTALTLLDEVFELLVGRIRMKFEYPVRLKSPTAVLAVRGTEFMVRSLPGRPDAVVVVAGQVAFSDLGQTRTVLVNAGQQSYILPSGLPAEPTRANLAAMSRWWEDER